mgnify:CR=1 FL=1
MALKKRKDITLGSGKLYVQEYTGTTVPETEAICTDDNILGYISGGATLSYKPTFYNAKDDLGLVTLKSGVMTWDGNTLTKLSATARVTETDAASGKPAKRSVKIGGVANADGKKYVLCFKHADKDGKRELYVRIVGKNESGFEIAFAKDKETVIDAEFAADPMDAEGTLIYYDEVYTA